MLICYGFWSVWFVIPQEIKCEIWIMIIEFLEIVPSSPIREELGVDWERGLEILLSSKDTEMMQKNNNNKNEFIPIAMQLLPNTYLHQRKSLKNPLSLRGYSYWLIAIPEFEPNRWQVCISHASNEWFASPPNMHTFICFISLLF